MAVKGQLSSTVLRVVSVYLEICWLFCSGSCWLYSTPVPCFSEWKL